MPLSILNLILNKLSISSNKYSSRVSVCKATVSHKMMHWNSPVSQSFDQHEKRSRRAMNLPQKSPLPIMSTLDERQCVYHYYASDMRKQSETQSGAATLEGSSTHAMTYTNSHRHIFDIEDSTLSLLNVTISLSMQLHLFLQAVITFLSITTTGSARTTY
jgi:hypothetical protein